MLLAAPDTPYIAFHRQEKNFPTIKTTGNCLYLYGESVWHPFFTQQSQLLDMVPYPTIILCTHTSAGTGVSNSFKFVLESDQNETRRLLAHLGLNYY